MHDRRGQSGQVLIRSAATVSELTGLTARNGYAGSMGSFLNRGAQMRAYRYLSAAVIAATLVFPTVGRAQLFVVRPASVKVGTGISPYSYGPFLSPWPAPLYGTGYYEPEVSHFVYGYAPLYYPGSPIGYWPNYSYPRGFVITNGPVVPAPVVYRTRTRFVRPLTLTEVLYTSHHRKYRVQ